jgi:hypothetical protein
MHPARAGGAATFPTPGAEAGPAVNFGQMSGMRTNWAGNVTFGAQRYHRP